ncbi:MAG: M1 family metallopeptidase [Planctomycetes bacterium]|nr:M1 family metallopeptidase [Planctomycetota bacterium]
MLPLLSPVQATPAVAASPIDAREHYDVVAYRLDITLVPESKTIAGWSFVEADVVTDELRVFELDMHAQLVADEVRRVHGELERADPRLGTALTFERDEHLLRCQLAQPAPRGARVALAVRYHGSPRSLNPFDGFHWETTASGQPWIGTSCQSTGSSFWWPCKDSFFHPEDKPARVSVNASVPRGLFAVSNGRLLERSKSGERDETFRWRHDYPLETYALSLNVAPYVVVEHELELEGLARPVDFVYYVLPEDAAKAAVQFAEVEPLLETFGRAFGPYPFPDSKFALVQTSFWGMEHSTAVAYGSTFPAWCKQNGVKDKLARRNEFFDYILVHEVAHEWWGNAVSAADWGDFWIHEGFGTYAEGVFVEWTQGVERAREYWTRSRAFIGKQGSVHRGAKKDSGQAYANIIYGKGAWVLHTLRTFVADDAVWFATLKEFNLRHRYGNASTADFRELLEKNTGGRSWSSFFEQWYYGRGYPKVEGRITVEPTGLRITTASSGTDGTEFDVPLDLEWREGQELRSVRIMLPPGRAEQTIQTQTRPRDVRETSLERVLGTFDVRVVDDR